MQAKAIAKYVRISPLKVNFICKEIRGKQVDEALGLNREDLFVSQAYANNAPVMKRWRPKAKGMAYPILKRSSHVGVVVEEREL